MHAYPVGLFVNTGLFIVLHPCINRQSNTHETGASCCMATVCFVPTMAKTRWQHRRHSWFSRNTQPMVKGCQNIEFPCLTFIISVPPCLNFCWSRSGSSAASRASCKLGGGYSERNTFITERPTEGTVSFLLFHLSDSSNYRDGSMRLACLITRLAPGSRRGGKQSSSRST